MSEKTTKYSDEEVQIRAARKEDMKAVAEMIQELADFEEMPSGPKLFVKELEHDGFELNPPSFKCKVAELKLGGTPQLIGYALYFPIYSTWEGRTMMLEDLYVKSSQRRHGLGNRLFDAVAREASSAGCARLDFHVLESNPARIFYDGKGAINITNSEKWCCYRLSGEALHKLSSRDKV